MDETIKKLVICNVLSGVGKITFLQLRHGETFENPQILILGEKDVFGIKIEKGVDKGCTYIVNMDQVETVY